LQPISLDLDRVPPTKSEGLGKDEKPFKKWTITVHYGVSKIEQSVACLMHLLAVQKTRPNNPNNERTFSPARGPIRAAVERYNRRLVSSVLRSNRVRRSKDDELVQLGREAPTSALATNYYTVTEHIRCLLYTWRQPLRTRSTEMQEHFALAVRHAMLLGDQDLRRMNLANISVEAIPKHLGGTPSFARASRVYFFSHQ
jgi:hypothetical protein